MGQGGLSDGSRLGVCSISVGIIDSFQMLENALKGRYRKQPTLDELKAKDEKLVLETVTEDIIVHGDDMPTAHNQFKLQLSHCGLSFLTPSLHPITERLS